MTNGILNVKREKVIEINEYIIAGAHNAVFADVKSQDIERHSTALYLAKIQTFDVALRRALLPSFLVLPSDPRFR